MSWTSEGSEYVLQRLVAIGPSRHRASRMFGGGSWETFGERLGTLGGPLRSEFELDFRIFACCLELFLFVCLLFGAIFVCVFVVWSYF